MARLGLLGPAAGLLSMLLFTEVASAQGTPPPPPPAPAGYGQPVYVAPTNGQPGYYYYPPPSQQPQVQYQPQPAAVYEPREERAHAPKYSLWAGARLSYLGFGLAFYDNAQGEPETTGAFVGNGIAPQFDIGARISYRYIPYLFWGHGFMGQGRRFEGTDAKSSTDFYGIGIRFLSGDVDSVAFLSDLSFGKRVVTVSSGSQSYSMSGLEFFRLGLGAEIRVMTLFALTPMASIATGALTDTEGNLPYACASKGSCPGADQGPRFINGQSIQTTREYVVLSLGLGIHFDMFGK